MKKFFQKRKIVFYFLFAVILSLLLIIVFLIIEQRKLRAELELAKKLLAKKSNTQLSPRALAFYEEMKLKGDSDWKYVDFEKRNSDLSKKKQILGSQSFKVGDCFLITIPFELNNYYPDGKCRFYFSIQKPKGRIFAYEKKVGIEKIDEEGGVKLRRERKYEEQKYKVNGRTFLIFQKIEASKQELIAFYLSPDKNLFVVSLEVYDDQDLMVEFKKMLDSVLFY